VPEWAADQDLALLDQAVPQHATATIRHRLGTIRTFPCRRQRVRHSVSPSRDHAPRNRCRRRGPPHTSPTSRPERLPGRTPNAPTPTVTYPSEPPPRSGRALGFAAVRSAGRSARPDHQPSPTNRERPNCCHLPPSQTYQKRYLIFEITARVATSRLRAIQQEGPTRLERAEIQVRAGTCGT